MLSIELRMDIDTKIIVYIKPMCFPRYIMPLLLQFPAYTTPTATPFSLGIMCNLEAASDEFCSKINSRAVQESQRYCVDNDIGRFDTWMTKQTEIIAW